MPFRSTRLPLAGVFVAAALFASAGCGDGRPAAGGARGPRADRARDEAQMLVVNAVKESARVTAKGTSVVVPDGGTVTVDRPAPPPPPPAPRVEPPRPAQIYPATPPPARTPGPDVAIRVRVQSSVPYPTEAEAEEDAVNQAREVLAARLAALANPVARGPSASAVRAEHIVKDSKRVTPVSEDMKEALAKAGLSGDRVYVEYEVRVTEDQVRAMRSHGRVLDALRVLGGLTALALAAFAFLRLDDWSKGYLTSWLGVGAAVLVAGAVAFAFLVG